MDFADTLLAETGRTRNESVASFNADFKRLDVQWQESR